MRRGFADIAARGDRLETLRELRDTLAEAIEHVSDGRELAALALRLQRVLAEIAELGGDNENEEKDDLAARRDAKLRSATGT